MTTLDDPVRLHALTRSGLLDKPVTDRMTGLVRTACEMLRSDAAQLNGVDSDMQHHVATWPPTPRSAENVHDSGCQYVVATGRPLVVPDSLTDPVLCRMPWTGTWRSYLGTPLWHDGQVVGSLCVLTRDARTWTDLDVLMLEAVARLVSQSLD